MMHESLTERPRVLIVDDLPENLFAMRQLLAEVDADLFTAQSGNEALGLMLQQRFCVVLLDVQMPEMDGFETAELMRSHEDTKSTPIIFITAISKEDRHVFHGYASGAVDYICKPVIPEILLCKIKVFIDLYRAMQLTRQLEREQRKSANLESIGTLAGGLAHDFNNLLFAVLGNIELAQDEVRAAPDQALKFLARAKDALLKGKELTSLMITFSKGGQPLKKACHLEELLTEAVATMNVPPGITVDFRIPRSLPEVELDWRLMRRAIDNILANACEAMVQGGRLTITAETEAHERGSEQRGQEAPWVTLRIADTGIGISDDDIDQVFDPYFSTKQKSGSKGMGLGLSVANSIIRNHHGTITLQSAKGTGTVVLVTLPLAKPQRPSGPSGRQLNEERQPPASGQAARVLVMDEDEMVRVMTCQMLHGLGFHAEGVRNSREALVHFAGANECQHPYALVVLDMTTHAGEDGLLALEEMRKVTPGLPAVAMVLFGNDQSMGAMQACGFRSCIEKPFTSRELKKTLEVIL